jgi:hypothetical protein
MVEPEVRRSRRAGTGAFLVRPGARDLPPTLRYRRQGFRAQTLLRSLLDPVAYPAAELVALYHARWELELGFDDVKTHTLERAQALRSKTPARVTQEVWGLALGYFLDRSRRPRAVIGSGASGYVQAPGLIPAHSSKVRALSTPLTGALDGSRTPTWANTLA